MSQPAKIVMPAAFFGHGSPMNTIESNVFTRAWRDYGAGLPTPRAILAISAHWYIPGTRVTAARRPSTIHDFSARFPQPLFDFMYPVAGDGELVERIAELAKPARVERDATTWGIDHGTFSVLAHVFPDATIPVVSLSIDRSKPPGYHYELAQRLAPLRDEGIFIMGSGNIVHNLELGQREGGSEPYDWARRFDADVRALLAAREHRSLIDYRRLGPDARLSIPTPEHYLPLLYTIALQRDEDRLSTIVDGFAFRAGGMRSVSIAA